MIGNNSFYIVLPSNVQPKLHPTNTASSYRTTFDRSYDLSNGGWEVGLMQMTFVNSLNNIVNESFSYREIDPAKQRAITLQQDANNDYRSETIKFVYNTSLDRYELINREVNPLLEYGIAKTHAHLLGFQTNLEFKDKLVGGIPPTISKHEAYEMRNRYYFKFPRNGIIVASNPRVTIPTEQPKPATPPTTPTEQPKPATPTEQPQQATPSIKPAQSLMQSKLPDKITLWEHTPEKVDEQKVKLSPAYYPKPEELAARLNGEQSYLEQKLNPSKDTKKKAKNTFYVFEYDKHENRFKVELSARGTLHFENGLNEILGFKDTVLNKTKQFADFAPLMNRGVYNFFIYCSICASTQVGNIQAPLLQTVEVEGGKRWGQPQTIRFNQPMYVPLSTNVFNSIQVEIRDDTGQAVDFATGKTNLILHFRRL